MTNKNPQSAESEKGSAGSSAGPVSTSPLSANAQEVFSLLVDAVEDYAIFALDPEGIILTWNAGGERLKGYAAHEVIGTSFSRFYTEEDKQRQHPRAELILAAKNGKYEEEGWRIKKDGSRFWANVVITALRDANGTLKGFGKVTRDLTERRRTELALKESEERFRLLIDHITDYALILLDTEGQVTSWNLGAAKITGYSAREILGAHFSRFYTPEDLAAGKPNFELKVARDTSRYEEEGLRVRKDGRAYWSHVVITAVRDEQGQVRGFAKVTRDITEKRETEERLRESEERFRLMVEGVEDYAIFMLDPEGHVATWNRGAQRHKGYRTEEILGQHFSVFYGPDDLALGKPAREIRGAIADGRFEDEGWRVRKDGSRFWANVILTAIYNSKRELVGFSKVTRNLTERKLAEDALRASHDELEARVEQRTLELSQAKASAEKAVAARDQFISMASHELKTPLASLKLQSQIRRRKLLKGDFSEFRPEKLMERSADDERQVNRLVSLVENMFDVSRMSSGTFELNTQTADVAALIDGVVKVMAPNLAESGNALRVSCAQPLSAELDQTRIEQVLTNLLSNCGKYAPGTPVELHAKEEGGMVLLSVEDQGPGIPASEQARLFQPFERIPQAGASGLGLGLYIIKQIVEAHGGRIELISEVGQGAKFLIRLPVKQAAPTSAMR